MYNIVFYRDRHGSEPVHDYLRELKNNGSKDARINLNKINDCIELLRLHGTFLGEPFVKHLDGEIWELRPIRNRILFAAWYEESFILLHHIIKKTRRTPASEIEKAKRELEDIRKRVGKNGKKQQ